MLIIPVINLKGGTTKTTTAAFVLHALHEAGLRTIGVDADGENESLLSWSEFADWPMPVVGMAVANLDMQLLGVVDEDRYDAVVIDTPPMTEHRGVVLAATRIATHVLVPMAPTPMEHYRLSAVRALLHEASAARPDGVSDPVLAVLLTRTVAHAASTTVFRELIAAEGVLVLRVTVARRESFAQAYAVPIRNATATAYGDAVAELLELEGVRV
jgi:chromosome partitioning protein